MNSSQDNTQRDEDEIDIREILTILKRYKLSIVLITLSITLISGMVAYFSPDIYRASTTFSISSDEGRYGGQKDILTMAAGPSGSSSENDIAMLQSSFLAEKALKNLNLGTRYFTKERYKTHELYKSSPFVVATRYLSPKAAGVKFQLAPVNEDTFWLTIEPSKKTKIFNFVQSFFTPIPDSEQPLSYKEMHSFDAPISTPWFEIEVKRVHKLQDQPYFFTIVPNASMTGYIGSGLSVFPASEEGMIVQIDYEDTVALRAKETLDAILHAYEEENLLQKTQSASKKLNFIDEQLKGISSALKSSSRELRQYKSKRVGVPLNQKTAIAAEKITAYQTEIDELNIQIELFENTLTFIELGNDLKNVNLGNTIDTEPINLMINQIIEGDDEQSILLLDFTELHPDVIRITEKLRKLKERLIQTVKSTLDRFKKRRKAITLLLEKEQKNLESLPQQQEDLGSLSRGFMVNENIYSYLLQKRAETAVVEASKISTIQMIEPSYYPALPVKPKRLFMIIVGFILGLIVGIGTAFIRAYSITTVQTVEDIEKLTSIPIYGALPLLPARKHKHLYLEALRVLRTNLEFLDNKGKSRLITFTSSVPTEGKTTTISELGKILAKGHKKVIILDLDLRRSRLHEKFSLENTAGMSTLLAHRHDLKAVLQHTDHNNLHVITSGPTPPNPSELIMSNSLDELITALLKAYDYVLLDTPPIGFVADAMITMHKSDINIIVLRAGYSKKAYIENINKFVKQHDLNAGFVLNGMKMESSSGYGYGYGSDYGYANTYYNKRT
ncbi:MAG: polysaccharide biosynthesis tyrosine autokinase [Campylobacterota bacterium]|nr:polysaccharide biosynthesis tyrosine autokinase [Campylobacterota bacterium]